MTIYLSFNQIQLSIGNRIYKIHSSIKLSSPDILLPVTGISAIQQNIHIEA